jgi:hypothetical protein
LSEPILIKSVLHTLQPTSARKIHAICHSSCVSSPYASFQLSCHRLTYRIHYEHWNLHIGNRPQILLVFLHKVVSQIDGKAEKISMGHQRIYVGEKKVMIMILKSELELFLYEYVKSVTGAKSIPITQFLVREMIVIPHRCQAHSLNEQHLSHQLD